MSNMTKSVLQSFTILAVALATSIGLNAQNKEKAMEQQVFYRTVTVNGLSIFYREAGPKDAPVILLLHGLPSSSRMFKPLLTRLTDHYHLVAPDYPGYGHSDWPDAKQFEYTFNHIASVMNGFTETLGLLHYTLCLSKVAGVDAENAAKAIGRLGKHDLSFDSDEPERFRKDVPSAEIYVLDAGHFALDTKANEIATLVREFMKKQ